jgi:hypothetical protein
MSGLIGWPLANAVLVGFVVALVIARDCELALWTSNPRLDLPAPWAAESDRCLRRHRVSELRPRRFVAGGGYRVRGSGTGSLRSSRGPCQVAQFKRCDEAVKCEAGCGFPHSKRHALLGAEPTSSEPSAWGLALFVSTAPDRSYRRAPTGRRTIWNEWCSLSSATVDTCGSTGRDATDRRIPGASTTVIRMKPPRRPTRAPML